MNAWAFLVGSTGPRSPNAAAERAQQSCTFLDEGGTTIYFHYRGETSEQFPDGYEAAKEALSAARQLTDETGAQLLLVFIPVKFRVYRDACSFPEQSALTTWQLSDLPSEIGRWAEVEDIPYIDLTTAFREAAQRRELVFFPDDTHWNAAGNVLTTARKLGLNAYARLCFIAGSSPLHAAGPAT